MGGGNDPVAKVLRHFVEQILGQYLNFGPLQKLPHSCP